jgi:hypothetical protein
MPCREEATKLGRYHEQHPNTAQNLLEAAWRHCGAIQDIIDRLNEADTTAQAHLLANRLHRLAFRISQRHRQNRPIQLANGGAARTPVEPRLQAALVEGQQCRRFAGRERAR